MEGAQRLINPWMLHLQKLGLELKCPLCLQLFNRPMLLPCNHIFCTLCLPEAGQLESQCPACKHQYGHREVKPAPYMENIVTIYKSIDATFNANHIHPDVGRVSSSFKTNVNNKSRNEDSETAQEGNSSNGQTLQCAMPNLLNNSIEDLVARSPPLSISSKDMDGNCSDPSSSLMNVARYSPKRSVQNGVIEVKRQKKTSDGFNDTKLETNGDNALASENVATASCKFETKCGKPLSGGQSSVNLDVKRGSCAFCNTSKQTEGSGPLLAFARGKEIVGDVTNFSKVTYVHQKCIDWTPRIYFKDEIIQNLESEVARANKLKCNSCGKKGAGLGCYMTSCSKTYHVPCAYDILECRWDCEEFLLLCPKHASLKFPREKKSKATARRIITQINPCSVTLNAGKNLVLCGSALSSEEKYSVVEFARSTRSIVSKYWRHDVTHVIAATDSSGACTRTLKVLMAVLNGKWIVTVEWVKACVEAGRHVNEEPYEVHLDTHGASGGPKAGRQRVLNKDPKLFNNLKFYFVGDFVQAFKNDLLNLVKTGGGKIIETKNELIGGADVNEVSLVVYNADFSCHLGFEDEEDVKFQRLAGAEDVAREFGSQMVGHTWILESIAGCRLLPFTSMV